LKPFSVSWNYEIDTGYTSVVHTAGYVLANCPPNDRPAANILVDLASLSNRGLNSWTDIQVCRSCTDVSVSGTR